MLDEGAPPEEKQERASNNDKDETGTLTLNVTLIGKHKDGPCATCKKPETVQDVLVGYGKYKEYRRILFSEAMDASLSCISE